MGDGFGKDVTVQGDIAQAERQAERQAPGVAAIESTSSAHLSARTRSTLSLSSNQHSSYRCALKVVGFTFRCGACFVPRVTTAKL